jgi:hypothetical protein
MATTKAGENVREAKEHLSAAYKLLLEVLDEDTHGHRDMSSTYIDDVARITNELRDIKKRL